MAYGGKNINMFGGMLKICKDTVILVLTHCGQVTNIWVFNTVKLGTSASSP